MLYRSHQFAVLLTVFVLAAIAGAAQPSAPVRVFILAGQSNMEGQGVVDLDHPQYYNGGKGILQNVMAAPQAAWRYAHIRDAAGAWVERDDVFVRFKVRDGVKRGKLSIGFAGYPGKHHIGPEFQFGHVVGEAFAEPVLLIKTAWGGKSLFADFRPPSAGGATGPFYQQMLAEVDEALKAVPVEFPQLANRALEISGFVWFQGWNDMVNAEARAEYETNLVHLIHDVRQHFEKPKLPVVVGELGNGGRQASEAMRALRQAQWRATARAEFAGTVAFAPTHEFARPAKESPNVGHGHHWYGNAESYFLIGDELGKSMLELLGRKHRVVRDIAYRQEGGADPYQRARCKLDLYLPANADKAPVLVWFHGGGLTAGSKDRVEATGLARFLADRGVMVANVNYRLSPNAKYPAYVEDAAAAVAWALEHAGDYRGDVKRVFVGGHSAGAYLALMVALDPALLEKHQCRPQQLAGAIPVSGQTDSHWTVRSERGIGRDQQVIDATAPLAHVTAQAPPMLLICADRDLPGRVALNEQLAQAMVKAGHQGTQLHVIPDRNHVSLVTWIAKPQDPTSKRILAFIAD